MSERESLIPDRAQILTEGVKLGMEQAVMMAREGNLRIAALPFEQGERPYARPIHPWRITSLAWRSWWREKRNRG